MTGNRRTHRWQHGSPAQKGAAPEGHRDVPGALSLWVPFLAPASKNEAARVVFPLSFSTVYSVREGVELSKTRNYFSSRHRYGAPTAGVNATARPY
jgi:hypothetical protein